MKRTLLHIALIISSMIVVSSVLVGCGSRDEGTIVKPQSQPKIYRSKAIWFNERGEPTRLPIVELIEGTNRTLILRNTLEEAEAEKAKRETN